VSDYKQNMLIYNAGAGIVDFTPTYPAVKRQPGAGGVEATRHDSFTSSGIKQSVLERIDTVTTLTFVACPATEMDSWQAFFTWALSGGVFAFRPDATDHLTWYEYTLDSMDFVPKWTSFNNFSVELKVRLYVGSTVVSGS
jgi:hypothetical protein